MPFALILCGHMRGKFFGPSVAGHRVLRWSRIIAACLCLFFLGACASIRVTNPYATATQQFLESEAARLAVQHISVDPLRDRKVFFDTSYLSELKGDSDVLNFSKTPQQYLFLVAELRSKMLLNGVRLVDKRENAEIIVEARTAGVGVDLQEFLIGLAPLTVPNSVAGAELTTPELAILKSTKQFGFASVAFVAYWRDTGELVSASGPFIGRTQRLDYWLFGLGPNTVGNIAPAQRATLQDTENGK
jgi:hypothetical protein